MCIYISASNVRVSLSTSSPVLVVLHFLDDGYLSECSDISVSVDLHFLNTGGVEHVFMYLPVIYVSSLEKCLFWSFVCFELNCLLCCCRSSLHHLIIALLYVKKRNEHLRVKMTALIHLFVFLLPKTLPNLL